MGVHDGHRKRLTARFLAEGLEGFAPHQALELLLFYSIPRQDTNELAHRLIDRFGSLSAVFEAPFEQLLEVEGVGEKTASLLKLMPAMARVYYSARQEGAFVRSNQDAQALLLPRFLGRQEELVYDFTVQDGFSDNFGNVFFFYFYIHDAVRFNTHQGTHLAKTLASGFGNVCSTVFYLFTMPPKP